MLDLGDIFTVNFLLGALSIPFVWGLVPRNRFYGFRVPATLRDDHVWYIMNRRVARQMIVVGFPLALAAALFDYVGQDTLLARALLTAATVGTVATITIRGWIAANRLARQEKSV